MKVRKQGRVFVCSMADIGHETVKPEWREAVYSAMLAAPWHTFIVLTKRPGAWLRDVPQSSWIGVTAEDQGNYETRWLELTAHVQGPGHTLRFVSVEPMLRPVTLRADWCAPDWVIAGPETGRGARECRVEWIGALAEQCGNAGVPFFDKRKTWLRREWPEDLRAGRVARPGERDKQTEGR